jgi:hypothetical protein
MEAHGKAKLVDAPAPGGGITATLSRSEIEETLKSAEPALLVLDIARRNLASEPADVEAHTLEVEMETPDLEQLLRTTSGDEIALRFDPAEVQQALDEGDVEGHGLREKAVILTVAAATAAGVAGQAKAMRADLEGGPVATAVAPMSDVVSGGPAASQAAAETPLVTDVTSGGPAGQTAESTPLVSDVVSGGPAPSQAAESSPLISDVVSGGPAGQTAESTPLISDVVSGGPAPVEAAAQTPLISDVVSGGPAAVQAAEATGGGGGIDISAPDAWLAGTVGGLALLITGASLAARRQRRPTHA